MTSLHKKLSGRARQGLAAGCCVVMITCSLWLQAGYANAQSNLAVTANFNADSPQLPDTPIELRLARELNANEGRIAIIIGRADVTSLFIVDGTRLVYSPSLVPLPLGESQVIVYRVAVDGIWHELSRVDLKVVKEKPPLTEAPVPSIRGEATLDKISASTPVNGNGDAGGTAAKLNPPANGSGAAKPAPASSTPEAPKERKFGFDKLKYVPSLTLALKAQPAQVDSPESLRPSKRATFVDGTLQFSLRSEMARGRFGSQMQFDFAGSTFQGEALRFGTLGPKAPEVDLSSYLAQFQLGRAKVVIGSTSFGTSRHLIDGFSSRGITVTVPLTKRVDVSVAAMNGTSVVGYGNFFGLGKSKHQLQSATIGVELFAKRPGGLRLEFSGLSAYIQPLNNISQGSINDLERSKGGSVRLIATDKAGRFKFDGGFTRSQYRNPADPLVYQGTNTVAVPLLTRNARYLDVSYDVLRGVSVTKSKPLNLSVAVKYEQVDPLFKSLGASAGADKRQTDIQLSGSLGEISFQAGHSRFNDNLRHIASILQSLTRSEQFSVALPVAALWGGTSSTSKFLPRLSYSRSATHQFGAAIPINGGFETNPSSVPNQFSTNQTFSADWQFQKLTVGSSYNRSFTNNQQRGRERFDFLNQTMAFHVAFNPMSKLSVNLDLTRDSATELESLKLSRTWRLAPTVSWTLNRHLTWTAGVSNTIAGDRAQTSGSRNTEFDTQFAYRYGIERGGLKKIQVLTFIRYEDRYARSSDLVFQTSNLTHIKIFNAGLNITLF